MKAKAGIMSRLCHIWHTTEDFSVWGGWFTKEECMATTGWSVTLLACLESLCSRSSNFDLKVAKSRGESELSIIIAKLTKAAFKPWGQWELNQNNNRSHHILPLIVHAISWFCRNTILLTIFLLRYFVIHVTFSKSLLQMRSSKVQQTLIPIAFQLDEK